MAVLRMVDEGKITVEQAEELLAALRGKSAKNQLCHSIYRFDSGGNPLEAAKNA